MNSHRVRLLEMIDEGYLDPETTVGCLVSWLSEDDVGEFLFVIVVSVTVKGTVPSC